MIVCVCISLLSLALSFSLSLSLSLLKSLKECDPSEQEVTSLGQSQCPGDQPVVRTPKCDLTCDPPVESEGGVGEGDERQTGWSGGRLRGVRGCRGDGHCPLQCVAVAAR